MYPAQFQYYTPKNIGEASELLRKHSGESKVLAGGMSLIPVLKLRLTRFEHIVDISGIKGLADIFEEKGHIRIGALATHGEVEASGLIRKKAFLMSETASHIGDEQVRNMGTIGGGLCHADPSGDWGSALIAMRGTVQVSSSDGSREIRADDFFVDSFTPALGEDEILSSVTIPVYGERSSGTYAKLERRAGDFAVLGAAVQLKVDEQDVCKYVGIGLTSLGMTNIRSESAEKALIGKELTPESIADAAESSRDDMDPLDDAIRGSAEYKKEVGSEYVKRALLEAMNRLRGGTK